MAFYVLLKCAQLTSNIKVNGLSTFHSCTKVFIVRIVKKNFKLKIMHIGVENFFNVATRDNATVFCDTLKYKKICPSDSKGNLTQYLAVM